AKAVRATLDLGAEFKLELRSEHPDEQAARDAQTIVRAVLYIARQALERLPAEVGLDAAATARFAPTLKRAEAALRSASVSRTKTALAASVRFKPTAADLAAFAGELQKAAERQQHINDLKHIGLAFHVYLDAHNGMPGPAIYDQAGKPLLSWRVA